MTLLTTTDMDGDTLNLGDHVEAPEVAKVAGTGITGEITQIFKNGKMRIKSDCDWDAAVICTPAEVALRYRGDS